MTKKIIPLVLLTATLGLNVPPALAATSASQSFKLSVTLPASVPMATENAVLQENPDSKTSLWQVTEQIVFTADHREILLRTTVVE